MAERQPDKDEFYRLRDSRSNAYLGDTLSVGAQIQVVLAPSVIDTAAGQTALLALANQLVRLHRKVHFFVGNDAELAIPCLFGGTSLIDELAGMVTAIDPFGDFTVGEERVAATTTIAVGPGECAEADVYLYWRGWVGLAEATPFDAHAAVVSDIFGAAVASVLGAAAALRRLRGLAIGDFRFSLWDFGEGVDADSGPAVVAPLNVGKALMVGAGGVASGLAYWLALLGHASVWTVVDGDHVTVSSTNRGLAFVPAHAGWGGGEPLAKAKVVADLLGGESDGCDSWYDDWNPAGNYDLTLCLANEQGVRSTINHFPVPIVLQATTGASYLAQLHRHIAGVDDCVRCRLGHVPQIEFTCSEATIETERGERVDAALPFLSAGAGLLLVGGLHRLAADELHLLDRNVWRWRLGLDYRLSGCSKKEHCACPYVQPADAQSRHHAHSRFAHLGEGNGM